MAPKKKIGVMTSGGDSPGMNGVVRAVVRMAIHLGCDPYCIYDGYEGLVQGGDMIRKAEWRDVRNWLSQGGTLIGTQRCMAFYERPGRLKAAKNMVLSGIDAIIICGGDGSLTGADKFRAEWPSLIEELVSTGELTKDQVEPYRHLNIVGLVGSIDNDMSGTDATIGCYSALERICEMVDYIEATAVSHARAFVIEVMGRHCGWLALMAGVATGADFIFIPEKPRDDDWQEEMGRVVQRHRKLGKRKTIVIVAEGAHDRHGNKISSEMIKDILADKEGLALDTRITTLGHVQRGGTAVAYDRMLATLQGVEAVKAVLEATPETETCFIAITENQITRRPLMQAVKDTKEVAKAVDAQDFEKAMALRDTEFAEMYNSYMLTTNVRVDDAHRPPKERMKIGFINVGAPAGGMNAAVRAGVAYCISRGHEPVAIHNGFAGFARHHNDEPVGSVQPFDWLEVDGWASRGGSEIGTNRELPDESGMEHIANLVEQYEFDALFLVGGFEAFHALSQLRKGRDQYPSLCIPMCLLPATISNNVPGSEYSLGSDTCLNELVHYCDKIKQSASATRRRVFVVETQGGKSGYIATLAGLGVGASAVYTPEEGLDLETLAADVRHLREVFQHDAGMTSSGRLILVNEKADEVFTAKLIADIIRKEARGRFESRDSIPGHVQQGGVPSPMDRCRAVRLAIKCMQHLEEFKPKAHNRCKRDPMSASVIGIKGAQVVFTPVEELEATDTDWKNRRPKATHWAHMKEVVDILGGRPKHQKPEPPLSGLMGKSGSGNIFIKNLDKTIDHKALHDTFSAFGSILSCKVATDASGQSKGFGFVQFDKEEAALKAIEKLNGMLLNDKQVFVGPFVRKQERESVSEKTKFNNVFVKNLSETTSDEDLQNMFEEFGPITSVVVMRDGDGKSKCFGFVNFENADDAARSVEALNGKKVDGKEWYVGKAQKKSEREVELKNRFEQSVKEAADKYQGTNLYVKNLDDSIDDDKLKELFSAFGTITSYKVMRDPNGMSRGSGFVAFSTPEEAARALGEMNGRIIVSKPLYVALAQRKEDRRARLQAQFSQLQPMAMASSVAPRGMPMYPPGAPGIGQQIFYGQAPPAIISSQPGFGYQQQLMPGMRPGGGPMPNFFVPMVQPGQQGQRSGGRRAGAIQQTQQPGPMMQQQMLPRGRVYRYPPGRGMPDLPMPGVAGGMFSVPYEMGGMPPRDTVHPQPIPVGALASALANAAPDHQRTMLGENLYPLVEQLEVDNAAKVTGMLLEMDQTEVLHLLESPEALKAKVAEAMEVLRTVGQQTGNAAADQLASLSLSDNLDA